MKIPSNAKIEFRRFRGGRGSGAYVTQEEHKNGVYIQVNEGDKKNPKIIKIRPGQVLSINGKTVA